MGKPREGESYNHWKERQPEAVVDSGEFIVDSAIAEGSAARYSLLQDRLTALETALRRHTEQMHNLHHTDVVHRNVKSWEECGMSSCRNVRLVLDEQWWKG